MKNNKNGKIRLTYENSDSIVRIQNVNVFRKGLQKTFTYSGLWNANKKKKDGGIP